MTQNALQSIGVRFIVISGLFCLMTLSFANDTKPHHWIAAHAPQSYIVQDGDTLWDIACRFLHDPWRWQLVWHENPEIQDPNLIFPGDELTLSYETGQPQIRLKRSAGLRQFTNHETKNRIRVVKLHPRIRKLPADNPIPTIPLNVIGPFFNKARVLTPMQATRSPKIIALDEDHLIEGNGDLIYVAGLSPCDPDTIFTIFRSGQVYEDPNTKLPLGIEGVFLAKAQLALAGEPARLILSESMEEVSVGDRVLSTAQEEVNSYFVPKYPNGKVEGQIISIFDGTNQIGKYKIIVLTGGINQHREVGDVLAIYQTQKDIQTSLNDETPADYCFPPLKVGICMVFYVFDELSYSLVMNATAPIYLLDRVGRP